MLKLHYFFSKKSPNLPVLLMQLLYTHAHIPRQKQKNGRKPEAKAISLLPIYLPYGKQYFCLRKGHIKASRLRLYHIRLSDFKLPKAIQLALGEYSCNFPSEKLLGSSPFRSFFYLVVAYDIKVYCRLYRLSECLSHRLGEGARFSVELEYMQLLLGEL